MLEAAAAVLSTGVDTDMEDPAEQEYVPEAIADQDDDGKLCLWMSRFYKMACIPKMATQHLR